MARVGSVHRRGRTAPPIDALELEVFRALFSSIAEEMGVVLQRSAQSPNIKERRDYSCALFDDAGTLVAQAAHIPVHLGSAPLSVRAAMAEHDFAPGESVLLNDPFRGGTHLPDLTLVSPVFLPRVGRPRAGRGGRGGRARPTSSSPRARTTPTSAAPSPARWRRAATSSARGS